MLYSYIKMEQIVMYLATDNSYTVIVATILYVVRTAQWFNVTPFSYWMLNSYPIDCSNLTTMMVAVLATHWQNIWLISTSGKDCLNQIQKHCRQNTYCTRVFRVFAYFKSLNNYIIPKKSKQCYHESLKAKMALQ